MITLVVFQYFLSGPLHQNGPVSCIDSSSTSIIPSITVDADVCLGHQTRFVPHSTPAGFPLQPTLVAELGAAGTGFSALVFG